MVRGRAVAKLAYPRIAGTGSRWGKRAGQLPTVALAALTMTIASGCGYLGFELQESLAAHDGGGDQAQMACVAGQSNVCADVVDVQRAPAAVFDCGTTRFNSSTLTFAQTCGQTMPQAKVLHQEVGPDLVVLPMRSLFIAAGSSLRLEGSKAVVLSVAAIAGRLNVSASGTVPGPGGNRDCGASAGGDGTGSPFFGGGGTGGRVFLRGHERCDLASASLSPAPVRSCP